MFFGPNSTFELNVNLYFFFTLVVISLIWTILSRKVFVPIIFLSVVENLMMIFNIYTKSILFRGVSPIVNFTIIIIWPILNIFLIIYYFKTKPGK